MAASSDEQTPIKTDENTATTSTNDTPTVITDSNTATTNPSTDPVVNPTDVKPTSTDTSIANESGNTTPTPTNPPSTSIDVPAGNETTSATSIGELHDPPTLTTDVPIDTKSTGFQPLIGDEVNPNPPKSFDLPSTTAATTEDKTVNLNFSPPIETTPILTTTVNQPTSLPITSQTTAAATTATATVVNETQNVQAAQPNPIFSIGGDTPTPSPTSPSPAIVFSADTTVASTPKTPPATTPKQPISLFSYVCAPPFKLLWLGIILVISLLELIIGWRYADDCPIHWRIPHYLVVAGCIGLVTFVLRIISSILRYYNLTQPNNTAFLVARAPMIVIILNIIVFVLAIAWWICGCIWVFRAWRKVQYTEQHRRDYCHPILYRFAFWLLVATIVCAGIAVAYFIRRFRQISADRNKGRPKPVPTSEP